jgi:hypothetical protein
MGSLFQSRLLRKILGPKCEEGTGDQRQLHSEKFFWLLLLTKYYSTEQIKMNKMGGALGIYEGEERRGAYRVLVGKLEENRPLEKPKIGR